MLLRPGRQLTTYTSETKASPASRDFSRCVCFLPASSTVADFRADARKQQ